MGREVRMVPPTWEHPKDADGRFIPLYGDSYSERLHEWEEGAAKWERGYVRDYATGGWRPRDGYATSGSYEDWDGARPQPEEYMPDWPERERTHFMMYENTSEGTPISPPFATAEELARWLSDTGASSFADMTATYEQWLSTIRRGFAVSAVLEDGQMKSGVEALSNAR
jgi:hypothetical protein